MNKYFKFPSESDLGVGYQYIEFNEEGWPIRQAERYGDRWFNSNNKYHQELDSIGLWDRQLTEYGMQLGEPVDAQEFETAWKLSNQIPLVPRY
jgi:hypothetical protein